MTATAATQKLGWKDKREFPFNEQCYLENITSRIERSMNLKAKAIKVYTLNKRKACKRWILR